MNIYLVAWTQCVEYPLQSVVIAESESAAIEAMRFESVFDSDIAVKLLGPCTDAAYTTATCLAVSPVS